MYKSPFCIEEVYYSAQALSIIRISPTDDGVRLSRRPRGQGDFVHLQQPPNSSHILHAKVAHRAPILVAVVAPNEPHPARPSLWSFDLLRDSWTQLRLPEFSAENGSVWPVRVSAISDYAVSLDVIVGIATSDATSDEASADYRLCRVDLATQSISAAIELSGDRCR